MLLEFISTVLSVPVCAYLLPGVTVTGNEFALKAGLVLGVIYLLLRGPLQFLTKPLGCITFGLMGTVVDALLIMLCEWWMDGGFYVESFAWALAAALVVNVVRGILGKIFKKDSRRK